ncbi:MAG: FYDLN acid domain-containing protein [Planctomycetota bacterium]
MPAIIIYCGECGAKIVTDIKHAGRAAVCADCEAKVPIPRHPSEKPQLRRLCPGCGKRVAADLSKAGHAMKCPGCKEEFALPKIKMGGAPPQKSDEKKPGKEKPSKKAETEVVPLIAADDDAEADDEDEILSLLRRMGGGHVADTDEVDRVEVLDDSDTGSVTGSKRREVPRVVDEDLQRADTQGLEPYGKARPARKAAPKKDGADRFRFKCPECGFRILASRSAIGKRGRCPDCKAVVTIEEP